ncbi:MULTISPECIES: recombinase family protein [unclassified Colwellia]|uniref:recombinase family protein n=1 Tax=unclassified Colwellia TaxID=196834 RepID=UPI0015F407E1|nr:MULTISPECIES: recombinase family protein [unclassified Colwellia]MBA6233976.1 recombinase family protein [Colwellia sp. MB02u-7]MBA6236960.1 recombinase family protein [Colwellia sp. MB02u-11]MBA6300650.1 recombinase family protein [Colwellia sp. MB3u-22]MBA6310591.1 recombinase family protein [Colwellia sp. MB3u-64]
MNQKAYSYIRYSSPQQAKGDSFRRQFAQTQKFCEENGYELDTDLNVYKELGKSAFKGEQENLKRFIEDCESGKVEKGSLLIVENLDRLSRATINKAMRQFLHLLDFVNIYTLQDKKYYSSNNEIDNDSQVLDIITSLLIMSRAHEESATKRKRLSDTWEEKRQKIKDKKFATSYPHWLILSDDWESFTLKEDAVRAIKKIYDLCINGKGYNQILRFLNDKIDQYPTPSNRSKSGLWVRSTVQLLLSDRRLIGEMQMYTGAYKERKPYGKVIIDYYPVIIDKKTFLKAQSAMQSRNIGKGKTGKYRFSNIFRGFLLCSICGNSMEYVDKGNTKKRSQKYLTCTSAKRGGECSHSRHYRYEELELLLLHLVTENGFIPKPAEPSNLHLQLQNLKEKQAIASKKLNALLEQDFTAPAIMRKVEELNNEVSHYDSEVKAIDKKLNSQVIDYKYDQLVYDLITEPNEEIKFNNRVNFNSNFSSKVKNAYVQNDLNCLLVEFVMDNDEKHRIILDQKYNFGGCSLSDGDSVYKRLNGEPFIYHGTLRDGYFWQNLERYISWHFEIKEKTFETEQKNEIEVNLKQVMSKLSQFIMKWDRSEPFLDMFDIIMKTGQLIKQSEVKNNI